MKRQGNTFRLSAKRAAVAVACALAISFIPACGGGGGAGAAVDKGEASGAAFSQPSDILVAEKGGAGIDTSHADEGYVSASATSSERLKFQVTSGDMTYNYDLPNDGTPMVYPMNMGDGYYSFRIMQNTSGNNYVEIDFADASVWLSSDLDPFLVPNMFCDYDAGSACVKKALEITSGSENQGEAVRDICTFVAGNVSYDNAKAEELSKATGYVPSPDETLNSHRGICFDYASLSAAMLRSMGIPTKLMTGYVGKDEIYHAWIMVYIDGTWQAACFSVSPNTWSRCDVTFASTGATQYTGDASAYTDKYTY